MTVAWIAVGVVLIAVELHHLAFYALFAALGCFAGAAVASAAPGAIAVQVVTAVVVAVAGIFLVRGRVSAAFAHHYEADRVRGVHGGLVGQEVLTLDRVGGLDRVGHVRLAGERWRARAAPMRRSGPARKSLSPRCRARRSSCGRSAVCSDLGLERWWPDPASVEHAREVGLLPEVRIP